MSGTAISVWSKVIEPGQDALVTEDVAVQITQICLEVPETFNDSGKVKRSILKLQHLEAEPALLSAAAGFRDDDSDLEYDSDEDDEDDEEIDSDEADALDESMAAADTSKVSKASTSSKKAGKAAAAAAVAAAAAEEDEDEDEDEDEEDDSEFEFDRQEAEIQVASLIPGRIEQINTNIILVGGDDFVFKLSGDYKVHLLGNYIVQPIPEQFRRDAQDGYDSEESDDEYDSDELSESMMYDPETGLLLDGDDDEDEDDSDDDSTRFMELEEDKPKTLEPKKSAKKTAAATTAAAPAAAATAAPVPSATADAAADTSKLSKNQKKKLAKEAAKKVDTPAAAAAEPVKAAAAPAAAAAAAPATTAAAKKAPSKKQTLPSGLVIEDGKVGVGAVAKSGQRVSMRYIGRLQNGKIFDQNTKGAPFSFKLGKGEVIKGWDTGIAGMTVGSERKLTIPPALAYGKQSLPGIPANSTLTFEVKLLSVK